MNRFSIRTVHDPAFGEPEGLLVEVGGGFDIIHREHRGDRSIGFLVEGIDFLRHRTPLSPSILSVLSNQVRCDVEHLNAWRLNGDWAAHPCFRRRAVGTALRGWIRL